MLQCLTWSESEHCHAWSQTALAITISLRRFPLLIVGREATWLKLAPNTCKCRNSITISATHPSFGRLASLTKPNGRFRRIPATTLTSFQVLPLISKGICLEQESIYENLLKPSHSTRSVRVGLLWWSWFGLASQRKSRKPFGPGPKIFQLFR